MINLLLVDDQRLVRRCVAARLNAVPDFHIVAEAASGEEARELVREHAVDIILMDLNMPGIGGLEASRRLLALEPGLRIIGLSMYVSGPFPKQFLRLGGAGYVSKNADTEELVEAIRRVAAGECYISADVAQNIAVSGSLRVRRNGVDALSRREVQVLQQIANGLTHEAIAARLSLSIKTVAHHRRLLLRKLEVANDVQLAAIARDQGLADSDALGG
ncbi:MAG: response regulator transcription factor [Gammaproteobacteria bacterium]|nr:response regulator transcription factor [Gammaproteobacteria bacterium]MCP5202202.1 response regulator transcription factor [Gammaproteobacteria bacterium]